MKKDIYQTEMLFRSVKYPETKQREILALFPYDIATYEGNVTCYAHIGQHGSADYSYIMSISKPATPAQYKDLKTELEIHYGYKIKVVKKQNRGKYIKALYAVRNKKC